jgi:hypothetical protein
VVDVVRRFIYGIISADAKISNAWGFHEIPERSADFGIVVRHKIGSRSRTSRNIFSSNLISVKFRNPQFVRAGENSGSPTAIPHPQFAIRNLSPCLVRLYEEIGSDYGSNRGFR